MTRFPFRYLFAGFAATVLVRAAEPLDYAGRVLLFSMPEFHGQCLIVSAGSTLRDLAGLNDAEGHRWDDRIASVRIEGNAILVLVANPGLRGTQLELRTTARNLAELPRGQHGSWLCQASSLRVLAGNPSQDSATLYTSAEATQVILAAYRDLLGRDPDYASLQYYGSRLVDDGWSAARLYEALRASPEYRHRDVAALVDLAYRSEMGHLPDPAAQKACIQLITTHDWTESELRRELRSSHEARRFRAREEVRIAYRTVLDREPDPAGLACYESRLLNGWTLGQLQRHLRRSAEYKRLHASPEEPGPHSGPVSPK